MAGQYRHTQTIIAINFITATTCIPILSIILFQDSRAMILQLQSG